jgi:putative endonuclease
MNQRYYVYITTNPSKEVLYTGMTNDLEQRMIEHYLNRGNQKTFAGKYYCYCLVYWEDFSWVQDAIAREKEIKGWVRRKKLELIKKDNPQLNFLNVGIVSNWPPRDASLRSA